MRPADDDPRGEAVRGVATPETEKALQWLERSSAAEELLGAITQHVRRRRRRRLATVSSSCLALLVAAAVWRGTPREAVSQQDGSSMRPTTATISAPVRQVLPDGSLVELKEGSAIAHDYTPTRRSVTLLRGEAHFQVAENPARPFVVTAGGVAVRAVGTAFSVQFGATAVEVLVTEGRVTIEKTSVAAEAPTAVETSAVLRACDRAVIRHSEAEFAPELSTVAVADLSVRLAWRVPQLEFSRTPLSEIIALMNQHGGSGITIVADLTPAELNEMKLSGFLAADNVDGLVRMLEANFAILAVRERGAIRLGRNGP